MTRKEFEEIKSRFNSIKNSPTHSWVSGKWIEDPGMLIQALENGGIEDEPDENDDPELSACPFCNAGTSALIFEASKVNNYQGRYICAGGGNGGCGATSGYGLANDEKTVKQNAAEKWNTRATAPTEPKRISGELLETIFDQMKWAIDWGFLEKEVNKRLED